jgi:hypothetical protein
VGKNRLGLIVCRVRDHDARGPAFSDEALEECVSEAPCGVLEIPFVRGCRRRDIFESDDAFQAASLRQLGDELSVGVRFRAAKIVIEMNDEHSDSEPVAQDFQQPQERHRIRAAGNGDARAISRHQHSLLANGFKHAICE